jgi:hypothetical protein
MDGRLAGPDSWRDGIPPQTRVLIWGARTTKESVVAYGSGLFRTGLVAVAIAASAPLMASCQTGPGYGGGYYGDSYSSWYDNDNRDWGYDRDRYRYRYRDRDRDDDDRYRYRRRDRDRDDDDDDRRDRRRSNSDGDAEQRFWKLFGKDGRRPDN